MKLPIGVRDAVAKGAAILAAGLERGVTPRAGDGLRACLRARRTIIGHVARARRRRGLTPTLKLKRAWPRAMASRGSTWPAQLSNKWKTSCLIGFGARFSATVNGTVERKRAPPFAPSTLTEPAEVAGLRSLRRSSGKACRRWRHHRIRDTHQPLARAARRDSGHRRLRESRQARAGRRQTERCLGLWRRALQMFSGRRAFPGDDVSDTIAAVLHLSIDWSALDPSSPVSVRRLLARCLERDVRRRLRDIGEARIVLEDPTAAAVEGSSSSGVVQLVSVPLWRRVLTPMAAAIVAAAAVGVAVWAGRRPSVPQVSRFAISTTAANELSNRSPIARPNHHREWHTHRLQGWNPWFQHAVVRQ